MATKKKAEPVKPVSSRAKLKKDKLLEAVVDAAVAETPENTVADSGKTVAAAELTVHEAHEAPSYIPPSGLLAHFPNGETREPTREELVEMGRAIAERIFGNRNVLIEPVAMPDAPPKPKISGNHCRLCKSFAGNDSRGALWSDSGHCLTYNHVQSPVEPEHYCERFVFNEALRDAEPR